MKAASTMEMESGSLQAVKPVPPVFGKGPVAGDAQVAPAHAHVRVAVDATVALPQPHRGFRPTLSPTLRFSTPLPTPATTPAPSCPMDHRIGHRHPAFIGVFEDHHVAVQIPAAPIFTRISPGAGSGMAVPSLQAHPLLRGL